MFSCLCAFARPGHGGGGSGDIENGVPAYTVRYWFNDGSGNFYDEYYGYGGWVSLSFWLSDDGEAEFMGWSTSPDEPWNTMEVYLEDGDPYPDPYNPSSQAIFGTEVYAIWAYPPEETRISFSANGGEGAMPDQIISPALATNALDACAFTRRGYDFIGWSEYSLDDVAEFSDTVEFSQFAYKEDHGYRNYNLSLYAIWRRSEGSAIVSFNANGGSGKMSDQMFVAGESEALSSNTFSRSGYLFMGWATSPTGEIVYNDGEVLSPTEDMTLYPVWLDAKPTLSSSSIRFTSSGGSGSFKVVNNPVGEWTAAKRFQSDDWFSFSVEGDTVYCAVNANTEYSSRTGRIIISNGVGSATFIITQEPKPVSFEVSQKSFRFDSSGGMGRIVVNTAPETCWWAEWDYFAVEAPDGCWVDFGDVDFEEDGIYGDGELWFTVAPNAGTDSRSTTVWLYWDCGIFSGSVPISIDQEEDGGGDFPQADFLSLEEEYLEVGPETDRISIMVECSASWGWMAGTSDDWIIIETPEGCSGDELAFYVEEHLSGPPREGSVTVNMECNDGTFIEKTVTIVQPSLLGGDKEGEAGSSRWICDVFNEGSQWVTLLREWVVMHGYDYDFNSGVFFVRIAIPARKSCRVWIEGGDSDNITLSVESVNSMDQGSFIYSDDGKSAVKPFDDTRGEYEEDYYFICLYGDIGESTLLGWNVTEDDPEFEFIGGNDSFRGRLVGARLNGHTDIEVPAGTLDTGTGVFANTAVRSVIFPASFGTIGARTFQNCTALESVTFLGDAPNVAESVFDNVGTDSCRIFVRRGSTGWGCEIPGVWNRFRIDYFDALPALDDNLPEEMAIQYALWDMEDEKLKCNLSDKKDYEAFREWNDTALGNGAMPSEIRSSQTVWQSFVLDCETLLMNEISDEDVTVEQFTVDKDGFSMEISIDKVSVGDKADGERLKQLFGMEGSTSLDLKSFKSEHVSLVELGAANGKLRLTAEPGDSIKKDGHPNSFFMRVRVNQ